MEVAAVEKLNSLPVSTSVIPTLYSLMILPFWSAGKGGFQMSVADREEILFTAKF